MFLANIRGWRTRQRIIVIESDDWGSIRISSQADYARLVAHGYRVERSVYSVDALETDEDLDKLFAVLDGVRDRRGRPACMTANVIMANPDFERVRESGFREYAYEPVATTLARSPDRQGVARLWAEGLERRVFVPQLHGREHVCWWDWLKALQAGSPEALLAFEMGMCGVPIAAQDFCTPMYLDAETLREAGVDLDSMVREGAELFEKQFGMKSLSAIAPNYCWTDHVERIWADVGVRYIQGTVFQRFSGGRRRTHYFGQRSPAGQYYLVRNCFLEHRDRPVDALERCLRQVARAFRFHKPAIIGTHRVNYIGSILPESRRRGLDLLDRLLRSIVRRWPDVIFLSSPELGYLIEHGEDRLDALGNVAVPGNEIDHG
jgi:hypothetical protein